MPVLRKGVFMRSIPVTKPFFTEEEELYIADALHSGWVAQGERVAEFERRIAEHEGVKEGIAVTSCTTALHLAMVAEGLSSGMDAIAPAFTFVATENAILQTGATPVMVDVSRNCFNMDIHELERLIETQYKTMQGVLVNKETGNRLWGIVPVHEFGLCCDIRAINALAEHYQLKVIEDAACALGAKINEIHPGGFGNVACISFHPRKSITTGEGGMVLTDDSELAKHLRELRSHGSTISAESRDKGNGFLLPEVNEAGFNYRMTDVQGAIGLAQIKKLDRIIKEKRRLADLYRTMLAEIPGVITPVEPHGYYHTYQSYVCMLDTDRLNIKTVGEGGILRNQLLAKLGDAGIATRQGTHAVHLLGYYRNRFGYRPDDFKNAYACDHLSFTLPLYYGLSESDMEYIVQNLEKFMEEYR